MIGIKSWIGTIDLDLLREPRLTSKFFYFLVLVLFCTNQEIESELCRWVHLSTILDLLILCKTNLKNYKFGCKCLAREVVDQDEWFELVVSSRSDDCWVYAYDDATNNIYKIHNYPLSYSLNLIYFLFNQNLLLNELSLQLLDPFSLFFLNPTGQLFLFLELGIREIQYR